LKKYIVVIAIVAVILAVVNFTGAMVFAGDPDDNSSSVQLTVTVEPVVPVVAGSGGTGGGGAPSDGVIIREKGPVALTIPSGTYTTNAAGNTIPTYQVQIRDNPNIAPPPVGANIIGLTYDFAPSGATFSPPITLTYTYDPDLLPEGADDANMVLAFYNDATGEWVMLDCIVDPVAHTITAQVSHFTVFASLYLLPVTVPIDTEPVVVEPALEPVLTPTPTPTPDPVPTPVVVEPDIILEPEIVPLVPAPEPGPGMADIADDTGTLAWLWSVLAIAILFGVSIIFMLLRRYNRD